MRYSSGQGKPPDLEVLGERFGAPGGFRKMPDPRGFSRESYSEKAINIIKIILELFSSIHVLVVTYFTC